MPHNGSTAQNLLSFGNIKFEVSSSDRIGQFKFARFMILMISFSDIKSASVTNAASDLFHFFRRTSENLGCCFSKIFPALLTASRHILSFKLIESSPLINFLDLQNLTLLKLYQKGQILLIVLHQVRSYLSLTPLHLNLKD